MVLADIQTAFASWTVCANSDGKTNSWFYLATALIVIATEVVKLLKYSLASSLLHAVPSTLSLMLKKFKYVLYAYIDKYTNF